MRIHPDLISATQAAKIAGETPANFRHFILREETPEPYIIEGRYYFERQDMQNWVKPHKIQGKRPNDR